MRKRQERESGIKSRGFCHHAKELGHYSVYDRKALKSETALIKSVCVCVCLRKLSNTRSGGLPGALVQLQTRRPVER